MLFFEVEKQIFAQSKHSGYSVTRDCYQIEKNMGVGLNYEKQDNKSGSYRLWENFRNAFRWNFFIWGTGKVGRLL